MAIVFPGQYCLFNNARTASISLTEALAKAHPIVERTKNHYATQVEQEKLCIGGEVKFAVIRNPFDLVASWFCFAPQESMEYFLKRFRHPWFRDRNGRLFDFFKVDRLIRYEALEQGVYDLMEELNLPLPTLSRLNPTPGKQHYSTYYTPDDVRLMHKMFPEIEEYGYKFEPPSVKGEEIWDGV